MKSTPPPPSPSWGGAPLMSGFPVLTCTSYRDTHALDRFNLSPNVFGDIKHCWHLTASHTRRQMFAAASPVRTRSLKFRRHKQVPFMMIYSKIVAHSSDSIVPYPPSKWITNDYRLAYVKSRIETHHIIRKLQSFRLVYSALRHFEFQSNAKRTRTRTCLANTYVCAYDVRYVYKQSHSFSSGRSLVPLP